MQYHNVSHSHIIDQLDSYKGGFLLRQDVWGIGEGFMKPAQEHHVLCHDGGSMFKKMTQKSHHGMGLSWKVIEFHNTTYEDTGRVKTVL